RVAEDPVRFGRRQAAADQGPRRAEAERRRQGRRARARPNPGAEAREQARARAARAAAGARNVSRNDDLLRQGPREAPEPDTAEERSKKLGLKTAGGGIAAGGRARRLLDRRRGRRRDHRDLPRSHAWQEVVVSDRPIYMISVAAELVGMHPQTLRLY